MECVSLIDSRKPTSQNFHDNEILNVTQQIELELCKLWHKHYLGELPEKLSAEMAHNHKNEGLEKRHSYNTRNKHLHNVALAKCKHYSSSFLIKGNIEYSRHTTLMNETKLSTYSRKLRNELVKTEKY